MTGKKAAPMRQRRVIPSWVAGVGLVCCLASGCGSPAERAFQEAKIGEVWAALPGAGEYSDGWVHVFHQSLPTRGHGRYYYIVEDKGRIAAKAFWFMQGEASRRYLEARGGDLADLMEVELYDAKMSEAEGSKGGTGPKVRLASPPGRMGPTWLNLSWSLGAWPFAQVKRTPVVNLADERIPWDELIRRIRQGQLGGEIVQVLE